MRWLGLIGICLPLCGCMGQADTRVGWLVLLPFVLVLGLLWLLNRHRGEEPWEEKHFPDQDDDDNEDHHLM